MTSGVHVAWGPALTCVIAVVLCLIHLHNLFRGATPLDAVLAR